jgi:general secretion pathway protein A
MSTASYVQHFGLESNPFSNAPDPRFLYMSQQHKEALAHLLYGLGTDGGVIVLTGDIGSGKTTVCHCLFEELPGHVDVARIDEPDANVQPLLVAICRGFGIEPDAAATMGRQIEHLNAFLLDNHARGRQSMLLIDEAQRLSVDVLEQLRLLTNLETNQRKLLQIVLVGQPDLRELLARPELRQLSQRIAARCHLLGLAQHDVAAYVQHRLAMAGGSPRLIPARMARRLHALSRGIPRTLNQLCDRALLHASAEGKDAVDGADVARAAQELGSAPSPMPWHWDISLAMGAVGAVAVCMAIAIAASNRTAAATTVATAAKITSPAAPQAQLTELAPPAARAPTVDDTPPPTAASQSLPAPAVAVAVAAAAAPKDVARSNAIEGDAYAGLVQRWGASHRKAPWKGCAASRPDGLRCLHGRTGLNELRQLDLPAVLHLQNAHGRPIDALLQALQGDSVSLWSDGSDQRLSLDELAARWHGDFTLLWRAPPAYEDALRLGSRGPAVAWLRTRIAQVRGEPAPTAAGRPFDKALLAKLRQFQIREGLDPDGNAGMKTLARLAARTDSSVPSLTKPADQP